MTRSNPHIASLFTAVVLFAVSCNTAHPQTEESSHQTVPSWVPAAIASHFVDGDVEDVQVQSYVSRDDAAWAVFTIPRAWAVVDLDPSARISQFAAFRRDVSGWKVVKMTGASGELQGLEAGELVTYSVGDLMGIGGYANPSWTSFEVRGSGLSQQGQVIDGSLVAVGYSGEQLRVYAGDSLVVARPILQLMLPPAGPSDEGEAVSDAFVEAVLAGQVTEAEELTTDSEGGFVVEPLADMLLGASQAGSPRSIPGGFEYELEAANGSYKLGLLIVDTDDGPRVASYGLAPSGA